jgi:predicted naringenin-chalcone synthase
LANIISIATSVPAYCHKQTDIFAFMQNVYQLDATDARKLKFLYDHSGISTRYSAVADYNGSKQQNEFIPSDKNLAFPLLEQRMEIFDHAALAISIKSIRNCIQNIILPNQITHLITISCTGMSAPGLDLQLVEALGLRKTIFRTSINFMGCYAAIHGLKIAKMICDSTPNANVIVVATELCTLHFQKKFTEDNAASSLLFADGSAAVLVSNCIQFENALQLKGFYSQIANKGEKDMAWNLSSKGFLMRLSSYIPQLIEADVEELIDNALQSSGLNKESISHWCIHPGGKRILDVIQRKMQLKDNDMKYARSVLHQYGNMSSPTVLFVLKEIIESGKQEAKNIIGMAFGPGLTMETFIVSKI